MSISKKVTYCVGDGIGPEIMEAVLSIMEAARVPIEWEEVLIGEKVYLSGNTSGISAEAWETIRRNKVFLKAPITTPQGGGYKSLNVTIRKSLALFANVRPCRSYAPFVETKHPEMDVIIVRENEEDLYAGIEHQQTDDVVQCLKLITRPGCERVIRYAFALARQQGRKKVTCFSKDNIMKQTDGLFHRVFDEIAREYPDIEAEHMIVDIGAARLADTPERFDVVVMPNLYGDILSDVAAQISGSVGMAGSANIGEQCAMFEAIHGSAPDIAGQNIANPSGLLQGAIMMLNHLGLGSYAETIQNAWLRVIEKGIHTADIYREGRSTQKVSTRAFAEAVIAHLGEKPQQLKPVSYKDGLQIQIPKYERRPRKKELLGVDVFVDWDGTRADELAEKLQAIQGNHLRLSMITNRGVKVWPNGFDETFCTDHWRCRFESAEPVDAAEVPALLQRALQAGIDVIKTENLYTFDGQRAFSLGQGQ
ncbi:isocitrate dehydrogenase [Thermonema lapsum]|uniref:Isocitrate dehydrogenase [NADP] n=1 Tax=Thermonema lapsum TaxID=28195 RepID=A0A846MTK6_9BACT|nr:NADP-dependent isocitrate dehydrogenase [Thermonema lapsum]NIK74761.1 isocitrate dehydrogenase [Thermonema lapsum]